MRDLFCAILFLVFITPVLGQKIETASGDISILVGEKELSLSFGYDNMNVHGYPSEATFIKDKVKIREDHNPGSGEKFKKAWFSDRETVYELLFIENFNRALPKKRKIKVSVNNTNAKYNLHIQTLWVYPGYNVGPSQPAKIELLLQLYEIEHPETIVWESKSPTRIKGTVAPYKRELRIGSAYSSLASGISFLLKKAK
ncbi:hypothetical protein F6U93_10250 [Tamlana haliotis]|uniref:Uncharacterized protein n=1 Tax=Pseudotamlana haliotis TaxID=2614804 RepID=A0A6N6MB31_9FLAO|nr:hypothetical protein [Tamlana haliotis]KAB1067420.1 hypothetical protein F6U93_10250 [Tamlana haliotis]